MLNELKFALRRLRHSPGFTAIAIVTIAVAVGANTAILSIADAVLFRPLPYRDADRLFLVMMRDPQTGQRYTNVPGAYLKAIDDTHSGLGSAGRIQSSFLPIETPSGRQSVPMLRTSANYFDVLGVTPALGRLFTAGDSADFERVAVLSFASWQTRFGGERTIVGRDVTFGARTLTVLGVLPKDFVFPAGSFVSGRPEVITMQAPPTGPPSNAFHPIYRLEPGVTRDQAQAEIEALVRPLQTAQNSGVPWLVDVRETIYPTGQPIMRFLLSASLLLLMLACANLANLLLARGRRQEREHAVRMSLGASRLRVLRPVLLEGLIVGTLGSTAAILLNLFSFDAIKAMVPSVAYGNAPIGIGWRVAVIAFAVGISASLAFAALPAWRSTRLDVQALIRQRQSNQARAKGRLRASDGGDAGRVRDRAGVWSARGCARLYGGAPHAARLRSCQRADDQRRRTGNAARRDAALPPDRRSRSRASRHRRRRWHRPAASDDGASAVDRDQASGHRCDRWRRGSGAARLFRRCRHPRGARTLV